MSGEGIYQLSSVKKVEVSDAFLRFNLETRKCQNQETFETCQTNIFLNKLHEHCKCKPYNLRAYSSSNKTLCDRTGLECVRKLEPQYQGCVKSCTGIYSDVSKDDNAYKKSFDTWQNIFKSYKEYKNLFNKDIVYPPDLLGLCLCKLWLFNCQDSSIQ